MEYWDPNNRMPEHDNNIQRAFEYAMFQSAAPCSSRQLGDIWLGGCCFLPLQPTRERSRLPFQDALSGKQVPVNTVTILALCSCNGWYRTLLSKPSAESAWTTKVLRNR